MADFDKFNHMLIKGEFAERGKILSGLTIGEVTKLPAVQMHTIYDELWHAARWQRIVVHNDQELYNNHWTKGEVYPVVPPKNQDEWDNLVKVFLLDLGKCIEYSKNAEILAQEVEPGVTIGDCFESLAVHNAYHLGKIVALRQMLGVWPPKEN